MRQRIPPSGPFPTYARVLASALAQSIGDPNFVISFVGGSLAKALRFVISGTDIRYVGNPRVLVGFTAVTSAVNTDVANTQSALRVVVNGNTQFEGPAVVLPTGGTLLPLSCSGILELVTNDLIGLRLVAPVSADLDITQLLIFPIGDGENA